MFKGIGTDLVEIARIERVWRRFGQRFLDRIFTKKEQEYCLKKSNPAPHLAARFAAKEAVAKALGTGLGKELAFTDIEVVSDLRGKPELHLSSQANAHFFSPKIHISLSHSDHYATAVAVALEPSS